MYEHILVPVDDSELARRAMERGIGLAKMLGASITALTIEPPLPVPMVEQMAVTYPVETLNDHAARCETHARALLKAFGQQALAAGVSFDGQFMISDDVERAILDVAGRSGCDLILMATHGRHGFDALLHGSLTKGVLVHGKIDLLAVH